MSARGHHGMTYAQIGHELGLSPQRVQQIYAGAIAKLCRRTPNTLEIMAILSDALYLARLSRQQEN